MHFLGDGIDFWQPHKWQEEIEKYQVLCMVHDVFKIALHHGFFPMSRVNLLIVDECHHSFGNSSFNQIFTDHYHPLKKSYPGKYTYYLLNYEGKPKHLQNYDKRLAMEQHPFRLINFFIAVR